MDFHLRQWRNLQHESDQEEHSSKLPSLLKIDPHPHPQQPPSGSHALPPFVSEPTSKLSNLSPSPADSTSTATKVAKMGSYFKLAQWQELELQALIFKHMLAGKAVPPELLHLVKKSLLNTPYHLPNPLHHHPYYQPTLQQSGYWERAAMDPEPSRCRRNDGKKWRCSRDVVAGHKHCEGHMNRGRNRSRKPVEIPTPTPTITTTLPGGAARNNGGAGCDGVLKTNNGFAAQPLIAMACGGNHFALSGPSPSMDLLHFHKRPLHSKTETKGQPGPQNELSEDGKSGGRTLRHFFVDWPKSLQEPDNAGGGDASSSVASATNLSISLPGNPSSDFSLKLSTGVSNGVEPGRPLVEGNVERERRQLSWSTAWGTNQVVAPMGGGPLAEVLTSATSNSSFLSNRF